MSQPGVLLLNLGSPDSTSVSDVRRYLREFLLDARVIDAPAPIRWLVVNAFILPFRPRKSAEAYRSIWLPEGSPLIHTSAQVRDRLRARFPFPIEMAMRYRRPSAVEALTRLRDAGVDRLFLLPMYPHYAMSSYETAVVQVMEEKARLAPGLQVNLVPPFYRDPDYIHALAESARPYLAKPDWDLLLFSYHGIPVRHLRKSDPSHAHCTVTPDCCNSCHPAHATCYRHQCLTTSRLLADRLGLTSAQYTVSFQSRLGRDPWLTPYTDQTLEKLARAGVKRLKIICPAFTVDCLETLEEISVEGRESFLHAGGEEFEQIPCLNDHPAWIDTLAQRIRAWADAPPASFHLGLPDPLLSPPAALASPSPLP